MAPIISDSERQKIESSPTQTTSAHTLHPYVSVTFKSSQSPPVASLTPPPPRHYLRNATSNEKLQGLIQKRSDIYTRVQQAQQEEFEGPCPCAQPLAHAEAKVCAKQLTRSPSLKYEASMDPWGTQIALSASWKTKRAAPGRPSNRSLTEIRFVEFESLGAQRREAMVLGLSEVDAHLKRNFDSEDGASVVTHPSAHYAPSNPNRGEVKYRGGLGTAEQIPVEIEMPASDTQGSNHDFPKSFQDAVDLNDDRTTASHHTKSTTPHGFPSTQRRRARTLQRARKPKDSFPPPRGSSLGGNSLQLDPHVSSSVAARAGSLSHPHPIGFPADNDEPQTRNRNTSHKNDLKCAGCKAVSKAVRHLGVCFWSNACTNARGQSGNVHPSK